MKWRELSADEFAVALRERPYLERDVFGAYEPPLVTYNDFRRGLMWPESVVIRATLEMDGTESHPAIMDNAG